MKIVYNTCCGIDVHKKFLVATIIKTTDGVQPSYQKKRFSTFNSDIRNFKQWLLDNNCLDICMESTGKYWVPVFNLLEDCINVTIANPKWVKAMKGNKDDTKDSKWIGDLFRPGLENTLATVLNLHPVSGVKKTLPECFYHLQCCSGCCCFRYVWKISFLYHRLSDPF